MANRDDGKQKRESRRGIHLALIGFVVLGAGWYLTAGPREIVPEPPAELRPRASAPGSGPGDGSPQAAAPRPGEIELRPGREARIDLDSLVPGQALAVRLALPPGAGKIGIEATWLYGEGHPPTEISSHRADAREVRIDFPPALLTPGRHIVELRTDEGAPISLRRYSFEIR